MPRVVSRDKAQWIQIRFPNIPTIRRVGISLSIFEPSVHAHGLTLYRAVKRKLQDNRSEKVVAEFVPQHASLRALS